MLQKKFGQKNVSSITMKIKYALLGLSFLFLINSCVDNRPSQSASSNQLSDKEKAEALSKALNQVWEKAGVIPAIGVVVVGKNGVLYDQTIGYSDYIGQIPVNERTNFYQASVTKSFTGLLVHILAKDLQLDLSKQIIHYKPFKDFEDKRKFEGLSILDLITHQSGLDNDYLSFRLSYSGNYTRGEILRLIEQETFKLPQGRCFNYSNLGYYFVSEIIYAEFGKKWDDLLAEKIFEPLKMDKTTTIADFDPSRTAMPHIGFNTKQLRISDVINANKTMHAAGGILSNTGDIARFLSLFINKGKVDGIQLFDSATVMSSYMKEVHIPTTEKNIIGNGYGSGWIWSKIRKKELVYHSGSYQGYVSDISFMPDENIGVAIMINQGLNINLVHELRKYAYTLYLKGEEKANEILQPILKKVPVYLEQSAKEFENVINKQNTKVILLSLPNSSYMGTYRNENYGTIEIVQTQEDLYLKCGNLGSQVYGHSKTDCIKVNLLSPLGENICFKQTDNTVIKLIYNDATFVKIK